MNAKFMLREVKRPGPDGKEVAVVVEHVELSGGFLGEKDAVVREATDADKRQYGDEYAEFKAEETAKAAPAEPAAPAKKKGSR